MLGSEAAHLGARVPKRRLPGEGGSKFGLKVDENFMGQSCPSGQPLPVGDSLTGCHRDILDLRFPELTAPESRLAAPKGFTKI